MGASQGYNANLEALRPYSIAVTEKASGGDPVPFLKEAVALDHSFAAPYAVLANVYYWRGMELEAEEAITKAFDLRTSVSVLERLMIEAAYHKIVTQDAVQRSR
ncbi:MAG: hypothetical protein U5J83_05000 [Bryobacterales bacterium]|nr:hypothetical protein [Bryobacterales bacterium]